MHAIAKELGEYGFAVRESVFAADELEQVRLLLDPLFAKFFAPPSQVAVDPGGDFRSPEINAPTRLVPQLRHTAVFAKCQAMARELQGSSARYVFDHAIYKAAQNGTPTPWHQDEAYGSLAGRFQSLHFWIPLQDATPANGCLQFIPGSHRHGALPHRTAPGKQAKEAVDVNEQLAVACPVRAGGMTVHVPRTLHAAGGNATAEARKAWIIHFGPMGRLVKLHPRILAQRWLAMMGT